MIDHESNSSSTIREKSKAMKQEGKDILSGTKEEAVSTADINKVVFACDAGLGSVESYFVRREPSASSAR